MAAQKINETEMLAGKGCSRHRRTSKIKRTQSAIGRQHGTGLLVLGICVVLAIALRIPTLSRQSLWFDEVRSFYDALGAGIFLKKPHLLVYLLMKLSMAVGGENDFLLRLPSALSGILSVIAIYFAGVRAFGVRVGILAAFITSISIYNVWYSQEARYYAIMMCLAGASLYFLVDFLQRKRLVSLLLMIVISFVNVFVHLTTLVFLFVQVSFVVAWVFSRPDLRRELSPRRMLEAFRSHPVRVGLPAILLGVVLVCVLRRVLPYMLLGVTNLRSNLGMTPGVDLSWGFLWHHFTAFTTFRFYGGWPARVFFWFVGAIFVIAMVWLFVEKRRYFSFFLYAIAGSFAAIFAVKLGQQYAEKYVSFLFPCYVLILSYGLERLGGVISTLVRRATNIRWLAKATYVALVLPLIVANGNALIRYYGGERMNYKDAVKEFLRQAGPRDVLAAYGLSYLNVNYYFRQHSTSPHQLVNLPSASGTGLLSLHKLKRQCYERPGVWFIQGWVYDTKPALLQWVEERFELVKTFPSLKGPYCWDVHLYRWKYPQRYVYYSFPLQLELMDEAKSVEELADSRSKIMPRSLPLSVRKELLFEQGLPYIVSLIARNRSSESANVGLVIDDSECEAFTFSPGEQDQEVHITTQISPGVHILELKPAATQSLSPLSLDFKRLTIRPDLTQYVIINAEEPIFAQPLFKNCATRFQERECFIMKRNGVCQYDVYLQTPGEYLLEIVAINDKPGPVGLEFLLDDTPIGIVLFNKADNRWGSQGFVFPATAGEHLLSVHFLTNYFKQSQDIADEDNDAIIDYMRLRLVSDDSGRQYPEDRLQVQKYLLPIPSQLTKGFSHFRTDGELPSGWSTDGNFSFDLDRIVKSSGDFSLRFTVPAVRTKNLLRTPYFPVAPKQYLYFSAKIKTAHLSNHSANVLVQWLDESNKTFTFQWVNLEGVTGDSEWVREVFFRSVPDKARAAIIGFAIYSNSVMPTVEPGYVWFDDFRFESYSLH